MTTNVNITVTGKHVTRVSLQDRTHTHGEGTGEKWKANAGDSFDLNPGEHREVVIHDTRRVLIEELHEVAPKSASSG